MMQVCDISMWLTGSVKAALARERLGWGVGMGVGRGGLQEKHIKKKPTLIGS